jgi:hypothetical protein
MQTFADKFETLAGTSFLGPAQVLEVDPATHRIRLRLAASDDEVGVWARVAVANAHELCSGDTVLVIGDGSGNLYGIGLLDRPRPHPGTARRLTLGGGAYAEAAGPSGEQKMRVFSNQHELLFEYDEEKRKALINLESGDLEFVSRHGNIAFRAGREIALQGQSVRITSPSAVRLGITDALGKIRSALALRPDRVELNSAEINVEAARGEVKVEEATYAGRNLSSRIGCVKLVADRFEAMVQTVVEKAKNVYQTVEQLHQLKAGRMRALVASTYFFRSRKALVNSEEDYKIKAEKIHLG